NNHCSVFCKRFNIWRGYFMQQEGVWLTIMGLIIIISIVVLLIAKRISPVVGILLIPSVGALILGYNIGDIVKFFNSCLHHVINVVIMFIFAIICFGIMIDASLFKLFVNRLILLTSVNVVVVCIVSALILIVAEVDLPSATTLYLPALPLSLSFKPLCKNRY